MDRKRQGDEPTPRHRVRVRGLPIWLDFRRLLGASEFRVESESANRIEVAAELTRDAAAELEARLRGVGLGGQKLELTIDPKLPRSSVRAARAEEARRYREGSVGFSRRGARLDPEARRSLTPEALALELGRRAQVAHVIDAGAGAGGNAIGFARAGSRVTAIERDPERLAMARHNAALYGVEDRIEFLLGDARELLAARRADLLFVDPPWGARYDKFRVEPSELALLSELGRFFPRFPRVWLKLPPSFACETLPEARVEAVFGVGRGDSQRVKFLLLELRHAAERAR